MQNFKFKNAILAVMFFGSTVAVCNNEASTPKPLLISGNRHSSTYLGIRREPIGENIWLEHDFIFSDKNTTACVGTTIKCLGIPRESLVLSDFGAFTHSKQEHMDDALPTNSIVSLPLQGADLLGVRIADTLYETLSKRLTATPGQDNNGTSRPVRELVVWQSVAIDPAFDYQAWYKQYDYIVVENALFQSEDITQTITDPQQLMSRTTWDLRLPAPSHETLFKNAVSRATMPSNASQVKHKLFLMYASDLPLLSEETLTSFAEYHWIVVVLGDTETETAADKEAFSSKNLDFLYLNCLGKTQEDLKAEIVEFYIDNLPARADQAAEA